MISIRRCGLFLSKEFTLMRRDTASLTIMIVLPILLLVLFGLTVNLNPQKMPTALISNDQSVFTQRLIAGLENTKYFSVDHEVLSPRSARQELLEGNINFVITIPSGFTGDLIKGDRPDILLETGNTNPAAIAQASSVLTLQMNTVFDRMLSGSLEELKARPAPAGVLVHHVSNPAFNSKFTVIPGTIGLVIMLSMLMITTVVTFRDREEGALEYLLLSPAKPVEIILGTISAYVLVGYMQLIVALVIAKFFFGMPFAGNLFYLLLGTLPYIFAELSLGLAVSTFSHTQLQAVQISNLFIAISLVLSGFVFPYWGIPDWARPIAECIPLTHYLRIVRGVMINDIPLDAVLMSMWPLLLFIAAMVAVSVWDSKKTL